VSGKGGQPAVADCCIRLGELHNSHNQQFLLFMKLYQGFAVQLYKVGKPIANEISNWRYGKN